MTTKPFNCWNMSYISDFFEAITFQLCKYWCSFSIVCQTFVLSLCSITNIHQLALGCSVRHFLWNLIHCDSPYFNLTHYKRGLLACRSPSQVQTATTNNRIVFRLGATTSRCLQYHSRTEGARLKQRTSFANKQTCIRRTFAAYCKETFADDDHSSHF